MEGLIIWLLITLSLVFLIAWNRDSKELFKQIKENKDLVEAYFKLVHELREAQYERYKDFATRWGVKIVHAEIAFVRFDLAKEDDFREWGPAEFVSWYNSHFKDTESPQSTTNDINHKLGQAVDEIFKK